MPNIREYKKFHKPVNESKTKYKQGYYVPENKNKIIGGDIIYRSSWEFKLARWCDLNPNVFRWGCEIASVEYRDPGSVKLDECRKYGFNPNDPSQWEIKNYYIDFYIEFGDGWYDGNPENVRKMLVEIKPYSQTIPPEPIPDTATLRAKKKFNLAAKTYLTNSAKWAAAREFAKRNGAYFTVWTEKTLNKIGIL
jgi:hypothetical protein